MLEWLSKKTASTSTMARHAWMPMAWVHGFFLPLGANEE
jgi:hypothetical protein